MAEMAESPAFGLVNIWVAENTPITKIIALVARQKARA
jgi:hypothetical protein